MPGDTTPGSSYANIVLFDGTPQTYLGGGQSFVTETTTSNCNDSNIDMVTSSLAYIQWWATSGSTYQVSSDTMINGSSDAFDPMSGQSLHYTWSFTKMDE